VSAHELTATYNCKEPSCTNPARSRVGRYSYCDYHRERREAEQRKTGVPASLAGKKPKSPTLANKVAELARAAKRADRARVRAVRATEKALEAKREADARERALRELARDLIGDVAEGPGETDADGLDDKAAD
jgi:hypothetical protein